MFVPRYAGPASHTARVNLETIFGHYMQKNGPNGPMEERVAELERLMKDQASKLEDQASKLEWLLKVAHKDVPPPPPSPRNELVMGTPDGPRPIATAMRTADAARPIEADVLTEEQSTGSASPQYLGASRWRSKTQTKSVKLEASIWDASLLVGVDGQGRASNAWEARSCCSF